MPPKDNLLDTPIQENTSLKMRFPKHSIDVDIYLKLITSLLSNDDCEIFIDTNIISQLYKLNDDARKDLYSWISSCKKRFHVPVWSIHEYSKRVYSNSTNDYIAELNKAKNFSSEFKNISKFIKAYISSSMLKGTQYEDKQILFSELDTIDNLLEKISTVIKNKTTEHKNMVHREIIEQLEPCALTTDIYSILSKVDTDLESRYNGHIPPGFKDEKKELNAKGDLMIWLEILEYCKKHDVKKAILLTRDRKSDIVYEPSIQKKGCRNASPSERVRLAHESLVFEFSLATHSNEFFVIDFETLVKVVAPKYRELAKSFQISEAKDQQNNPTIKEERDHKNETETYVVSDTDRVIKYHKDNFTDNSKSESKKVEAGNEVDNINFSEHLYSGIALKDSQYDTLKRDAYFDEYIEKLSSYDWYVQNPALDKLMNLRNLSIEENPYNIDSTFVLGRNIIQSAEGSSGSAISFMENMPLYVRQWPNKFKQALIDGMLFEVFFNSNGEVRTPPFKASYFEDLLTNIHKLNLDNPYKFINEQLNKKSRDKFVPKVGSSDRYLFEFTLDDSQNVEKIECNKQDITKSFPTGNFPAVFAQKDSLRATLSSYYAIPETNIDVAELPKNVTFIGIKVINWKNEELPF